ncbi:MAG TPA: MBOAT family O-acyltransferase [Candidatus Methylomirabilis sp.]|nr:MBOAT family O-acyltransferase [Candidatus Methylomirabilis sp.]
MLFNSYEFIFGFLPLLLLAFGLLGRWQARRSLVGTLVAASLVYYGWWNWRYLWLILFSILFNFGWAHFLLTGRLAHPSIRGTRTRAILALGIAVNLGLLGYFKYAGFVVSSLDAGLGMGWQVPAIVLPLGISFFTFEQITYLVDTYRGESPDHDFLSYSLFVTFFPHLFAGPIVRPRDLIPQFSRAGTLVLSQENLTTGLFVFAIGLFKKVYLADMFGRWVGPIFDQAAHVSFADAWAATLAFALQVYFDFSGYSDMAIGLAGMLNVRLPENFDSPYKATSIIDFWRRWHMTLSGFLRDYVFLPLAGIRGGQLRRYAALVGTMLLCGLWHGANWTFVVFGGLHGVYLATNHLWRDLDIRLPRLLCWFLTFVAVLFSFVFFRAQTFSRAGVLLRGMAGLSSFAWGPTPDSLRSHTHRLLAGLVLVTCCPNRQELMQWRWASELAYAAAFAVLAGLSILQLSNPAPFVYFQF